MYALKNNVVGFKRKYPINQKQNKKESKGTKNVYSSIMIFLQEEVKSEATRRSYLIDIEYFFKHMLKNKEQDKEITELTEEDLYYEYEDILEYRNHLRKLTNKNGELFKSTTINRKITSLKSLYRYLAKKYNVDRSAFDLKELDEFDSVKHGFLTPEENEQMIELAKNLPNQPIEISHILEMLYLTGFRIQSVLNLEWKDFKKNHDGKWIVRTVLKGKEDKKPIEDEFYQRLKENKKEGSKIFGIKDPKTVNSAIKKLCKQMGIEEERNISAHSMKKTLINWELRENGSVRIAAKQGGHSISTMEKYYEEEFQDWDRMPGILIKKTIDLEQLRGKSVDELINIIASCTRQTQMELLSKLQG